MDDCKRFDERSLPDKEAFYSELCIEEITDKDYIHAQKVFEELSIKNYNEYHDLLVQSNTLFLADRFKNFRNNCIEIYKLDLAHFSSGLELTQHRYLKMAGVELELFADIDMLLMVKKRIRGETCHTIHRYVNVNNEYLKNYDTNIISSYLMYLDANNLYGWVMSQQLPVNDFKWINNFF